MQAFASPHKSMEVGVQRKMQLSQTREPTWGALSVEYSLPQ